MQPLNAKEVKDKIISILEEKGPSLPIQIAKATGLTTLFASAFLSELASENRLKISNMKVGGSPLYYTQNQQSGLERFIVHLPGKEREAGELLRKNQILQDDLQHPAIRVALRSLKDFAFAFKKENKIFWRYFLIKEQEAEKLEVNQEKPQIPIIQQETPEQKNEELEKVKQELEAKRIELEKFKQELEKKREEKRRAIRKTKKVQKIDETFLNEVKQHLKSKEIEVLNIEKFDKKEIIAKIRKENQEFFLYALNKKKIEEADLMKAHKKAFALGVDYYIISKAEPSRKFLETINAYKRLSQIDKLEQSKTEQQ